MGEAKRRKQLDPTYGKGQKSAGRNQWRLERCADGDLEPWQIRQINLLKEEGSAFGFVFIEKGIKYPLVGVPFNNSGSPDRLKISCHLIHLESAHHLFVSQKKVDEVGKAAAKLLLQECLNQLDQIITEAQKNEY